MYSYEWLGITPPDDIDVGMSHDTYGTGDRLFGYFVVLFGLKLNYQMGCIECGAPACKGLDLCWECMVRIHGDPFDV